MKFVLHSLTDEHNSTESQLVKTSVRPVRPLRAFSIALLLEISSGCFSMILKQNARVQSVEQNYHWVSLAKAQGENNVDHFIWQTESNSQRIWAWRKNNRQWIPCTSAGMVSGADFECEDVISTERQLVLFPWQYSCSFWHKIESLSGTSQHGVNEAPT